ncbi:MAG TPA: hypothetical protein VJN89_00090 [Candidatus Acidoferrum sp.]|nr:hypothetical protein [Candidatus Acidoferrum sp.]
MRRMFLLLFGMNLVLVFAGCASTNSQSQPVTVMVSPQAVSVPVGQSQTFIATVMGSSNTAVTWSVAGGGTITVNGAYTAPSTVPAPPQVRVTATSKADTTKSGSAAVTVTSGSTGPVAVSPGSVSVEVFTTQQFSATINGQASTAVTWQVNGAAGGNTTTGTISTNGLYSAPHSLRNSIIPANGAPVTVQIEAVSTANTSNMGTATVTLSVPNQSAEPKPIYLGTSGSNVNDTVSSGRNVTCCGGTLGALVTRGGTQYILSADHVLARSGAGVAGDPIVEPGLIDTNCSSSQTTTVANLTQGSFSNNTGTVDAAIAQVVSGAVNSSADILLLGSSTDASGVPVPGALNGGKGLAASINLAVAKSGRTTGLTCSTVGATNVSVSVGYTTNCDGSGTKFTVIYDNQVDVVGGDFSGGGDSGSLIVTQSNATPVALLYAGSNTDTVGNPVSDVLNFFGSGGTTASFVGTARSSPVIGCTLPGPQAAMAARLRAQKVIPSKDLIAHATAVREAHGAELMGHPEVQAVGVGASYDSPGEPTILLFVTKGTLRTSLPAVVDGVRTRIIEGESFSQHGLLSPEESAALEQSAAPPELVYSIPGTEVARAKVVHAAHANELMKMDGVQGVGITSSVDSPGEAALMIFLIDGAPHATIPAEIDGLRTRIRVSSRFRAGFGDHQPHSACSVPAPKKGKPNRTAALKPKV